MRGGLHGSAILVMITRHVCPVLSLFRQIGPSFPFPMCATALFPIDVTALRHALAERLERWDGGCPRIAEEASSRALDLSGRPLFLLGAGSKLALPFVRAAVAEYDVCGLVDNHPPAALRALAGGGLTGPALLDDSGFRARLAETPGALAVLCASSEAGLAHFAALAASAGVPTLTLIQALRRTANPDWAGHFADAGMLRRIYGALEDGSLCFADDLSRATAYALLLHRLTGALHWLDSVRLPERAAYFFTDILQPHDDEVFVDGGAFTGDSLKAFARRTKGRWRHIHAFEPDPACHPPLRATLASLARAEGHYAGLWSHSGIMPVATGVHHRVVFPGSVLPGSVLPGAEPPDDLPSMPVVAVDDRDLGPVSLIKMDIEGAESAALEGARQTLARFRPRLAVCVYHRPGDLVEIPQLLTQLRPDSQFYLRHHGPTLFETVLYVV